MATPSEKLAQSLEILKKFQDNDGTGIVKSMDISRTHRERLLSNEFQMEVIKGWYITVRPGDKAGEKNERRSMHFFV